jgi:hypothetical protein
VPNDVEPFFSRASQHVGHLSARRVKKSSWDFTPVTDYIEARFKVLRAVGKIPSDWIGDKVVTTRLLAKSAAADSGPVGPQAQPSNEPPRFVSVPTSTMFPTALGEFARGGGLDIGKLGDE